MNALTICPYHRLELDLAGNCPECGWSPRTPDELAGGDDDSANVVTLKAEPTAKEWRSLRSRGVKIRYQCQRCERKSDKVSIVQVGSGYYCAEVHELERRRELNAVNWRDELIEAQINANPSWRRQPGEAHSDYLERIIEIVGFKMFKLTGRRLKRAWKEGGEGE